MPSPSAFLKIGLTGGIASGKSTVVAYLKEQGIPTLSADEVVHQLYATDKELLAEIEATFGQAVLTKDVAGNRVLEKQTLAALVFNDPSKRQQLEALVHPKVGAVTRAFFEAARQAGARLAVAEIPLLFECGLENTVDETWLLVSTPEQQQERLKTHRAMGEQEASARMASQMPLAEKIKLADVCLDNTQSPDYLLEQVAALLVRYAEG